MMGIIFLALSAFSGYCAVTGDTFMGTQLSHNSIVGLWIVTGIFAILGFMVLFAKAGYLGKSSGSSSGSDGFFSDFSFGGDGGGSCDSGGSDSGSCGSD